MIDLRIPDHLAYYREDDWLPLARGGILAGAIPELRRLRAREMWRRAQDAWAHERGLDRAAFERLRDAQVSQGWSACGLDTAARIDNV